LFHNANLFGSCIIHILYTGCAKIKKNNSGAKRLTTPCYWTKCNCRVSAIISRRNKYSNAFAFIVLSFWTFPYFLPTRRHATVWLGVGLNMEVSETFYIILRFHSLSVHLSATFATLLAENKSNFLLIITIDNQQDATILISLLLISSTCFERCFRPSSEAYHC